MTTPTQNNDRMLYEARSWLVSMIDGKNRECPYGLINAELTRLEQLINTPQTADFLEAVKTEAAHQRERWGEAHDRSKSAENWFWLVGYLAGKALRAALYNDREKALHHTISSAAALMQWHAAILRDDTGAGLGEDVDLKPPVGQLEQTLRWIAGIDVPNDPGLREAMTTAAGMRALAYGAIESKT